MTWSDPAKVDEYVGRVGRLAPRLVGEAALIELLPAAPARMLDLGCGDGRLPHSSSTPDRACGSGRGRLVTDDARTGPGALRRRPARAVPKATSPIRSPRLAVRRDREWLRHPSPRRHAEGSAAARDRRAALARWRHANLEVVVHPRLSCTQSSGGHRARGR